MYYREIPNLAKRVLTSDHPISRVPFPHGPFLRAGGARQAGKQAIFKVSALRSTPPPTRIHFRISPL